MPALQNFTNFDFDVEVAMAAQDAAKMDVAMDVGLFELVHHLEYKAALQRAAGAKPKRLEPSVAKQIAGFAKARAREVRHCCQAAQRASTQRASMASGAGGANAVPLFQKREEKHSQMGLFDFEELELGPLLGVGGFSKVYEIKAFHPKQQQPQQSPPPPPPPPSSSKHHPRSTTRDGSSITVRRLSSSSHRGENPPPDSTAPAGIGAIDIDSSTLVVRPGCRIAPNPPSLPYSARERQQQTYPPPQGSPKSQPPQKRKQRFTQQQQVARMFLTQHAQRLVDVSREDGGLDEAEGGPQLEEEEEEGLEPEDKEEEIIFTPDSSCSSMLPPAPPVVDWNDHHPRDQHSRGHPSFHHEEKQEITASSLSTSDPVTGLEEEGGYHNQKVDHKDSQSAKIELPSALLTVLHQRHRGIASSKTSRAMHHCPADPQEQHDDAHRKQEEVKAPLVEEEVVQPTLPASKQDRWSFTQTILEAATAAAAAAAAAEQKNSSALNSNATIAVAGPPTTARYALKHLRQGLLDTPEKFAKAAMDLSCEGEMMMCLDHPHIVKLRGFGAGGPGAFKEGHHNDYFLIIDKLVDTLEDRVWIWRRTWKNQRRRKVRNLFHWCKKRAGGCLRAVAPICRCCISLDGSCRSSSNPNDTDKKSLFEPASSKKPIDTLLTDRLKIAYDLSSALEYLHERRIIYRDLKPSNIGFDIRGDVKLFDFGLSRFLPTSTEDVEESFRMSNVGTRRYTAPEVEWKRPYNRQADVYSFGVVLWEILTMSSPRSVSRSRKHQYLPIFRPCPCWPVELQRLVQSMLSVDPEQRPTITKVRQHLKQILMNMVDKEASDEIQLDEIFQCRRRSTFRVEILTTGLEEIRRDFDHLFKEGGGGKDGDDNKSHTSASTFFSSGTVNFPESPSSQATRPVINATNPLAKKVSSMTLPSALGSRRNSDSVVSSTRSWSIVETEQPQ
jgi:serine/threonine protein kinase